VLVRLQTVQIRHKTHENSRRQQKNQPHNARFEPGFAIPNVGIADASIGPALDCFPGPETLADLLGELESAFASAAIPIRALADGHYDEPRGVGLKQCSQAWETH